MTKHNLKVYLYITSRESEQYLIEKAISDPKADKKMVSVGALEKE